MYNMKWNRIDWIELDYIRLNWIGLDWTGMEWLACYEIKWNINGMKSNIIMRS